MLNLWRSLQVSECAFNLESFHIMNVNIKIMALKQNVWKISLFRSKFWYLEFMGKSNKSVNGLEKRWNWIWRKRPLSGPNLAGLPSLVFLVGTCFQPPADKHWLILFILYFIFALSCTLKLFSYILASMIFHWYHSKGREYDTFPGIVVLNPFIDFALKVVSHLEY